MHLTESQLLFLARFAKAPEGKEFIELMRAAVEEVNQTLRTATGEHVLRTQGRAQQLDEIVGWITEANRKLTAGQASFRTRRPVTFDETAAKAGY